VVSPAPEAGIAAVSAPVVNTPADSAPAEPTTPEPVAEPPGNGLVIFDPESHSPFGPGSLAPRIDGSAPSGYPVKGNLGTMLFHTEASRWFQRIKADVWFESEDVARAAGFTRWDQRGTSAHRLRD